MQQVISTIRTCNKYKDSDDRPEMLEASCRTDNKKKKSI
ncbi:protein of unknown function [Candidatus Nitrosocosmicus franklandus]|uniref:Uncharacterized protein n=1 Tax=Candidatus Nitrosocosmicus franklandianus TaxID=1798806 RepID=A0A484I404_9ARCH|nr:protein of unknown function [Candidatus Nitrosocosmicus franklandus]